MENRDDTIQKILAMQRRGRKDYQQTAILLEKLYLTLDKDGKSEFFGILERTLLEEFKSPLQIAPNGGESSVCGSIIMAWARFGPTGRLFPLLEGLITKERPSSPDDWAQLVYHPLNFALSEFRSRFSPLALDHISRTCRQFCDEEPGAWPGSLLHALNGLDGTVRDIEDGLLEQQLTEAIANADESTGSKIPKHRQLRTKEDYFAVSVRLGVSNRCPILERCERRAHTTALFNNWDLELAAKLVGLEEPIVKTRGESAYKIGGSNNFTCGGLCPEVCHVCAVQPFAAHGP